VCARLRVVVVGPDGVDGLLDVLGRVADGCEVDDGVALRDERLQLLRLLGDVHLVELEAVSPLLLTAAAVRERRDSVIA